MTIVVPGSWLWFNPAEVNPFFGGETMIRDNFFHCPY
jgi:hypothetical protein